MSSKNCLVEIVFKGGDTYKKNYKTCEDAARDVSNRFKEMPFMVNVICCIFINGQKASLLEV